MSGCRKTVRPAFTLLAVLTMLMSAAAATAQTVVDPQQAEFSPSPDHYVTTGAKATPLVKSYSLAIYEVGTAKAIQTINLGKPDPQTDGKIRVRFVSLLNPAPVPGTLYQARVAAVGPGGTSWSELSNTFSFGSGCSTSLTPSSQAFTSAAATGTVSVRTGTGCPWTAVSSAPWLTITGGGSGTESGSVAFSVDPNPGTIGRSATITVAGEIFTATQAGSVCGYSLSPASQSVAGGGGTASVTVTTGAACPWSAFSPTPWITVKSAAVGAGPATVAFSVQPNPGTTERTGTVMIAGQLATITEAGATGACTYALAPLSQTIPAAGGPGSFTLTTGASCGWSASASATWITITAGGSGPGSATVSFAVAANPTSSPRTGTITIKGQPFTVSQAGASSSCIYGVTAATRTAWGSLGGTGLISVATSTACAWTATSSATSWLTITSGATGSGTGTVGYSVAQNTGPDRTATITIAGQIVTITQAGAACTLSVSPTTVSPPATGTTGSITVTLVAGPACTWGSFSSAPWITVTGGGSGSGTANYTVAANTTGATRIGTILVAGVTIKFTQPAVVAPEPDEH